MFSSYFCEILVGNSEREGNRISGGWCFEAWDFLGVLWRFQQKGLRLVDTFLVVHRDGNCNLGVIVTSTDSKLYSFRFCFVVIGICGPFCILLVLIEDKILCRTCFVWIPEDITRSDSKNKRKKMGPLQKKELHRKKSAIQQFNGRFFGFSHRSSEASSSPFVATPRWRGYASSSFETSVSRSSWAEKKHAWVKTASQECFKINQSTS